MKVILIAVPLMDRIDGELYPIAMDQLRTSPPLGIYHLAGILRSKGYDAEVLDLIALGRFDKQAIRDHVETAELAGISANSLNWPTARLAVDFIKSEYPGLPVVLGGIHPTQFPEHVFNTCKTDYIIRGEGEGSLLHLAEVLRTGADPVSSTEFTGICSRDGSGIRITEPSKNLSVDDIEKLPDPAYDLLPDGIYETLSVESSRGCRFSCSFCSTRSRGTWRGLSGEYFVSKLERMQPFLEKTRNGIFSFVDDLYTYDTERVVRISDMIRERGMRIQATIDARASDLIREGVIDSIAPILNHMLIGAECGYDEGLQRIRKHVTTGVLEQAAALLREAGLASRAVFSFVIGFPFESITECKKTIEFAANLMVRHNVRIYLQWFNTIPGSSLWNALAREGALDLGMYDDFGFFTNARLFSAGVRLSLKEIRELSEIVLSLNKIMLFSNPNDDLMRFSPPEWLWAEPTMSFPSHGYLDENGCRPGGT